MIFLYVFSSLFLFQRRRLLHGPRPRESWDPPTAGPAREDDPRAQRPVSCEFPSGTRGWPCAARSQRWPGDPGSAGVTTAGSPGAGACELLRGQKERVPPSRLPESQETARGLSAGVTASPCSLFSRDPAASSISVFYTVSVATADAFETQVRGARRALAQHPGRARAVRGLRLGQDRARVAAGPGGRPREAHVRGAAAVGAQSGERPPCPRGC